VDRVARIHEWLSPVMGFVLVPMQVEQVGHGALPLTW
jgi:hypothetical protein